MDVPLRFLDRRLGYTGGSDSFVAFTAAPIATGWNEPVPGREFHPLKITAFHGALNNPGLRARKALDHNATASMPRNGR